MAWVSHNEGYYFVGASIKIRRMIAFWAEDSLIYGNYHLGV